MQEHIDRCKKYARQIKLDHPPLGYVKRLDVAAKKQGFPPLITSMNCWAPTEKLAVAELTDVQELLADHSPL